MKTKIFYFSGTGNSLFIAKELKKRIPDAILIPIAAILNIESDFEAKESCKSSKIEVDASSVGFVFPCHGISIPIVVKKFLEKIILNNSEYLFAIATRGGSVFRGFSIINKILAKQKKQLNASFVITMGMNDPKLDAFSVPTNEELKEIETNVLEKLDIIEEVVNNKQNYQDDTTGVTFSRFGIVNYILERLIPYLMHNFAPKEKKYFYADSNCVGCGVCEKVCLSGKIKMIDINGKSEPLWQPEVDCFYCYACLNFCPSEAVQIYSKFYMKSYTTERGRYPHPYAKVRDMINQKTINNPND